MVGGLGRGGGKKPMEESGGVATGGAAAAEKPRTKKAGKRKPSRRLRLRGGWERMPSLDAEAKSPLGDKEPPSRLQTKALLRVDGKWRESGVELETGQLRLSQMGSLGAADLGLASVLYQPRHRKTAVVLPQPAPKLMLKFRRRDGDWDRWLNGVVAHRLFAQRRFLSSHTALPAAPHSPPSPPTAEALAQLRSRLTQAKRLFLTFNTRSQETQAPGSSNWSFFRRAPSQSHHGADCEKLLHELGQIIALLESMSESVQRPSESVLSLAAPSPPQPNGTPQPPTRPSAGPDVPAAPGTSTAPPASAPAPHPANLPGTSDLDRQQKQAKPSAQDKKATSGVAAAAQMVETEEEEEEEEESSEGSASSSSSESEFVAAVRAEQMRSQSETKVDALRPETKRTSSQPEVAKATTTAKPVAQQRAEAVSRADGGTAAETEKARSKATGPVVPVAVVEWRERLPVRSGGLTCLSLGLILRAAKEGSLPLGMFEPLSTLQRLAEMMEHSDLMDRAMEEKEPAVRMGLVLALALSSYSGSRQRFYKPFNPLLGETFGLDCWEERGWRWESEQVSHSPDVSAYQALGRKGWRLWGCVRAGAVKPSFSYVSVAPSGRCVAAVGAERYEWCPLETLLLNPASSNPANRRLEHVGTLKVRSSSGLTGTLSFQRGSLHVAGQISEGRGRQLASLKGIWTESLSLLGPGSAQRQLFKAAAVPSDAGHYFGMGRFPRTLNQPPSPGQSLPATDSRLRPDQRALENGQMGRAEELKRRLETAQRARRLSNASLRPLFFAQDPQSPNDPFWTSNNTYWTSAAKRFPNLPAASANIFNLS